VSAIPRGHTAVMANRSEPHDSFDHFPTPPWATRALCEHVIGLAGHLVWEPACGTGIMSSPLSEYALAVASSDVHEYGWGHIQHDFLLPFLPDGIGATEWIVTNPPFRLAVDFVERGLNIASHGVAVLVRSVWAEGCDRYHRLFSTRPPTVIAQFAERVPMTKGRWDPEADAATSYAWFVWSFRVERKETRFMWIPPGCRKRLTKADDAIRFGGASGRGLSTCPMWADDDRPPIGVGDSKVIEGGKAQLQKGTREA
jgi:hypothetical protein